MREKKSNDYGFVRENVVFWFGLVCLAKSLPCAEIHLDWPLHRQQRMEWWTLYTWAPVALLAYHSNHRSNMFHILHLRTADTLYEAPPWQRQW